MSEPTIDVLNEGPAAEPVVPETPEVDYQQIMVRFLQALQQIKAMGTYVHHLRMHPNLVEGFKAELNNVPDEILPPAVRQNIQVVGDEGENDLRIITGLDVERMFLERHFGPPPHGNGLLPKMIQCLQDRGAPIAIDVQFLKHRYLSEVADMVDSTRVQVASGLDLSRLR